MGNVRGTISGTAEQYLLFDKDYNFVDGGYTQITSAGDFSLELVSFSQPIVVTEAGYIFVYLSNESNTTNWVYFDDLKITHTKSPVIQSDDYYPFGLKTSNSYSRENSLENKYLYNGKEKQDELDLGWYDYIARQYDPAIGRFLSIDPAADLMRRISPYAYTYNNPIRFTDPDGMIPIDQVGRPCIGCIGPANSRDDDNLDDLDLNNILDGRTSTNSTILAGPDPGGPKKPRWKNVEWTGEAPHPLKRPVQALGWLFVKAAETVVNMVGDVASQDILGLGPTAIATGGTQAVKFAVTR